MAKTLTRKLLQQFGASGPTGSFGQFGSLVAGLNGGAGVNSKDPLTIQSLTAWLDGWQDAVFGGQKAPLLEDMNGLFYVLCYQLCYLLQEGIPEWDATTTYYTGSLAKQPGTGNVFTSNVDGNLNNALPAYPTDNASWNSGIVTAAQRISGGIQDAQIVALSASKLLGLILDAQISGMSVSKLIGTINGNTQITAGTITGDRIASNTINGDRLIDQTIPTSKISVGAITQSLLASGSVGTGQLKTGTGFASGATLTDVTMNDYSFAPSLSANNGRFGLGNVLIADPGNTIARLSMGSSNQAVTWVARWRYMTSSDNPRIWIVLGKDGKIKSAWESEDPPNHADIEDGFEEISPFNEACLQDGESIVQVPVMSSDSILSFYSKLSQKSKAAVAKRFVTVLNKKGWVDAVSDEEMEVVSPKDLLMYIPTEKKDMGRQWLFRHIMGKTNIAKAIIHSCIYSPKDKQIYLKEEHAENVHPTHIELKETV